MAPYMVKFYAKYFDWIQNCTLMVGIWFGAQNDITKSEYPLQALQEAILNFSISC